MKIIMEVYKDVCVVTVTNEAGCVIAAYEAQDVGVENYQHERRYADPEGTLPIRAKYKN